MSVEVIEFFLFVGAAFTGVIIRLLRGLPETESDWVFRPPKPVQPRHVQEQQQVQQRLDEVAAFTQDVMQVHVETGLRARQQGGQVVSQLHRSLGRLHVRGELTHAVGEELSAVAETGLRQLATQRREMDESLATLAAEYKPSGKVKVVYRDRPQPRCLTTGEPTVLPWIAPPSNPNEQLGIGR